MELFQRAVFPTENLRPDACFKTHKLRGVPYGIVMHCRLTELLKSLATVLEKARHSK